jgi:hypothetical protein
VGIFNFLIPRKKIERLLADRVMAKIVAFAKQKLQEKAEDEVKGEVSEYTGGLLKSQANEIIPPKLPRSRRCHRRRSSHRCHRRRRRSPCR